MSPHPLLFTDYLEAEMPVGAKDAGVSRVEIPAFERFDLDRKLFFLRIQRDKFL